MNHRQIKPLFVMLVLSLLAGLFFSQVSPTHAQSSQVWSDPVNISNSGSALDPVIVVSSDGVLHAIWSMEGSGGFRYANSKDGVVWSPAQAVSFPFVDKSQLKNLDPEDTREFPFRLIPAPNGVIHIFWINLRGDLMAARSTSENLSNPITWGGVEIISESVLNFDVDVTAASEVHLAYLRNDDLAGVYYRRSVNGTTWSKIVSLYSSQYINTSMSYADAHVRVSASDDPTSPTVLVGWDMRPLKRIFMATSTDDGANFSATQQVKGPEDTGGFGSPLNIELGVAGKNLLFIWQIGEQGATQCTFYSQSSADAGETWTDPVVMLDARSLCPKQLNFLIQRDDFFMLMMEFKGGNPSLLVWNGAEWGDPKVQNELSSFTNPVTFDTILLGCKTEALSGTTLFIAGCDEGTGSDIWISSRSLEPLDQWTGTAPGWNYPSALTLKPQLITDVTQLAEKDRVHAVWSESSFPDASTTNYSIYYASMDGDKWSLPRETISGLLGKPAGISMGINKEGVITVVWVDQQNGSLIYSAVNSDRAGLRTEWTDPREIPTMTRLNSSPDVLVDSSGAVLVAYAAPFNEGRGIYLVEGVGRDLVWSLPIQVFDAVAAGWDRVDDPQISLTSDGTLHLLFSRVSSDGRQATGLYYSQSRDGGVTWSLPELIREGSITWSDMVTTDGVALHRLWQENQAGVVSNYHQVSKDGGATWESAIEVTGVLGYVSPVSLAANATGDLHFLRLVQGDSPGFLKSYELAVEDWQWNGKRWEIKASRAFTIKGDRANLFLSGGLTSTGQLSALVSADYLDLDGQQESQVVGMERQSDVGSLTAEPFSASVMILQAPTPQPTDSPVAPLNEEALSSEPFSLSQYKNVAGIVLVAVVAILGFFYFRRRAGGKS
ncbi:MAG: sialidase family protein [Anaerolineales bacterium]